MFYTDRYVQSLVVLGVRKLKPEVSPCANKAFSSFAPIV